MTFSLHDSIDPNGAFNLVDTSAFETKEARVVASDGFHIVREKLRVPDLGNMIERPRLTGLLTKSVEQYPATLVSGRSGTGKTAMAASFAAQNKNVSWYSVASTDTRWSVFSRYFSASLHDNILVDDNQREETQNKKTVSGTEIARFLVRHFSQADTAPRGQASLIVLDDIHYLFDAPWFEDFFNLLLYSLPAELHLLMLCRSKPPGPLWRLRSKQMLNVLDEKVIAFNDAETESLFKAIGFTDDKAGEAQRESFGRVSKLLEFAGV